jgi:hypothetical protein
MLAIIATTHFAPTVYATRDGTSPHDGNIPAESKHNFFSQFTNADVSQHKTK